MNRYIPERNHLIWLDFEPIKGYVEPLVSLPMVYQVRIALGVLMLLIAAFSVHPLAGRRAQGYRKRWLASSLPLLAKTSHTLVRRI